MSKVHQYLLADYRKIGKELNTLIENTRQLKKESYAFPGLEVYEEINLPRAYDLLVNNLHQAQDTVDNIIATVIAAKNNPVSSFKIDEPRKTAKKEKWWIVKLVDETGIVLKEVLVPFRTKTEIKLYVKSTIGKTYQHRNIHSAVVEGPYTSMMEASKHKSVP